MRILADQNIPFATDAFSSMGEVTTFVGRELANKDLHDVDMLLVRSVTRVDAKLLANTPVRFVGSATIGTDHIDLDYLHDNDIHFANAPGSNATSAAEYTLAAFLYYAVQSNIRIDDLEIGIVGYGNVGSRVARFFTALGLRCHIYDPPRQREYQDMEYADWAAICQCDVVTAHVPLTDSGDYPTLRMFDENFFRQVKPDALFINTSRGQAVDETALLKVLGEHKACHLVLDVWCNEPAINRQLLQQTLIGTPHIAGYAYDGKLRGTEMIYQAACGVYELEPQWSAADVLGTKKTRLNYDNEKSNTQALYELICGAYSITRDNDALKKSLTMTDNEAASHFDELRKHYPKRREFPHYAISADRLDTAQCQLLEELGFKVID